MNYIFLLILGAIALVIFIYRYARHSAWKATYQGRTLMAQKVAWLVLFVHLILSNTFPYVGQRLVGQVIVSTVVVLMWVTLWGLVKAQRSTRPVSKKIGQGYVLPEEVERTVPRPPRIRRKR